MSDDFFDEAADLAWTDRVEGRFGEFQSAGGTVSYILTTATLEKQGTSRSAALTQHLRPVREVLPIDRMDFNQLLQRDLDDHRVATELIPYLLNSGEIVDAPSFFPPILAVLLPVTRAGGAEQFPAVAGWNDGESGTYREFVVGDAFRVRRRLNADGQPHHSMHTELDWHKNRTTLVVLDGQHRAMALLGIHRTVNNEWEDERPGNHYRHFYEKMVIHLLGEDAPPEIEVPVAICWFPELTGPDRNPVQAARKLFVDVNKSARPPSRARLILLSDENLIHIFVRRLLNELKGSTEESEWRIPLYAIDYDNPSQETRSSRWSVLTTVGMVNEIVDRISHGPPGVIEDPEESYSRGGGPQEPQDDRLRKQYGVDDWSMTVEDGERVYKRSEIRAEHFPSTKQLELETAFQSGWGNALLYAFSNLVPFRAHIDALVQLRNEWPTVDTESLELAEEALFEGVGMYWVLRDSYEYYNRPGTGQQGRPSARSVVEAWEHLEGKQSEFEILRAKKLGEPDATQDCSALFEVYRTAACQLGLALTIATVAERAGKRGEGLFQVAKACVDAVNRTLSSKVGGRPRWAIMSPRLEEPLNRISGASMNTPRAVEFRYFWLEVLREGIRLQSSEHEGSNESANWSDQEILELVYRARNRYFEYRERERQRELKAAHPEWEDDRLASEATADVLNELRTSLSRWMEIDDVDEWQSWREAAVGGDESASDQPASEDE